MLQFIYILWNEILIRDKYIELNSRHNYELIYIIYNI